MAVGKIAVSNLAQISAPHFRGCPSIGSVLAIIGLSITAVALLDVSGKPASQQSIKS